MLETCLNVLAQHPPSLRHLYTWLLTHGETTADAAYRVLFQSLGWLPETPPVLGELPNDLLAGLSPDSIDYLWKALLHESNFDCRLFLAALLVWNFERNRTHSKQPYSAWLNHLPQFPEVLDRLFPLTPQEFTYQPFLEAF